MATSVAAFLTRIALDLNEEDNTFASGAWTQTEILAYLNKAERDFLIRTGIVKYDSTQVLPAGSLVLCDRPASIMDIERVSFNGKPLRRQTANDFELEKRSWKSNSPGNPSYYHEDHIAVNKIELDRIPAAGGSLRIIADYVFIEYHSVIGNLHLKDCWEQYLRWKVLALALYKDGDNRDLQRSHYADQRYMVGVKLAKRLINENAALRIQG